MTSGIISVRLREDNMNYHQALLVSETHQEQETILVGKKHSLPLESIFFFGNSKSSFRARTPIYRAWSSSAHRFIGKTVKHRIKPHCWVFFSESFANSFEIFDISLSAVRGPVIRANHLGKDFIDEGLMLFFNPQRYSSLLKLLQLDWMGSYKLREN